MCIRDSQHGPYLRVEAVSTNDEVAVLGAPVGQADRHPLSILGDPDALCPEPQDMLVEGGQQDRLEQSAVHHDRWRVDAGHSRFRRARRSKWSSSRAAERTIGHDLSLIHISE